MNIDTKAPKARDEMTPAEFNDIMVRGITEAKADTSRPAAEVFNELKNEMQKQLVCTSSNN